MNGERPQAELFDDVRDVSAVHAPAYANDAIVLLMFSRGFDFVHQLLELMSVPFAVKEAGFSHLLISAAMTADTVSIKSDIQVGTIHDAPGAGSKGGPGRFVLQLFIP